MFNLSLASAATFSIVLNFVYSAAYIGRAREKETFDGLMAFANNDDDD